MRILRGAAWLLAAAVLAGTAWAGDDPAPATVVEVYVQAGCPHCERALEFVRRLARERGGIEVRRFDVGADAEARARLRRLVEEAGVTAASTPIVHVGDHLEVGWRGDDLSGARILAALERRAVPGAAEPAEGCSVDLDAPQGPPGCDEPPPDAVDVPLFGRVDPSDLGLPLFTAVVGLVDGFNPCAMWVLLFLLSLLVNLRSRRKMLAIAGTFVLVSGLVYFAFMAAWLNFFLLVGMSRVVTVLLGVLAVVAGAVHVKDFFAFHEGVTLSIPEASKPGLYERARRVLRADRLAAAMLGVVALAFMVNVVELLCTAGLPAVYTAVLARHGLSPAEHYGYLALYQVFYMIDDGIMLTVAVVTLSRRKLQERGGRWLKLVSGVVILVLGVLLLIAPELLYW